MCARAPHRLPIQARQAGLLQRWSLCRWGSPEGESSMWAESLFDNTRSAIARSIEGIVHFMCTKVSRCLPCI